MVKTKRKSKRKSVLRKTAKNKSSNLQIFKQKLKKIQRDLVKLNKKYAGKTKKKFAVKPNKLYKSALLKGGMPWLADVHNFINKAIGRVPTTNMDKEEAAAEPSADEKRAVAAEGRWQKADARADAHEQRVQETLERLRRKKTERKAEAHAAHARKFEDMISQLPGANR